jgi:hypothetical protein
VVECEVDLEDSPEQFFPFTYLELDGEEQLWNTDCMADPNAWHIESDPARLVLCPDLCAAIAAFGEFEFCHGIIGE